MYQSLAARAVDAGAVAQTCADKPAQIKEAVHRARVEAVARIIGGGVD